MYVQLAINNEHLVNSEGGRSSPELQVVTTALSKEDSEARRIKFHETVNVHLIPHVDDMDDDEYFDIWYQKIDFEKMRAEFSETVNKITSGKYEGDDEFQCARGLEYRSRFGSQKRKLNKLRGLRAVLAEQNRQIEEDLCDDEALRDAYMVESHHTKEDARSLAQRDAKEAAEIFKEEILTPKRTSKSRRKKKVGLFSRPTRQPSSSTDDQDKKIEPEKSG